MSKLSLGLFTSILGIVAATQVVPSSQAATVPTIQESSIFVLGGAPLPITDALLKGDQNVVVKEQQYLASLGIIQDKAEARASFSKTINVAVGYTDVDAPF